MNYAEITHELRKVIRAEEGKTYSTCQTRVIDMAKDCLRFIEETSRPITGDTSDGYHTFNELYHQRAVMLSVITHVFPELSWKSKRHYEGTMYPGMFIVGVQTPEGQATYHFDVDPYWYMFECKSLVSAPAWDHHTPTEAIHRLESLKNLRRDRSNKVSPPIDPKTGLALCSCSREVEFVITEDKRNHSIKSHVQCPYCQASSAHFISDMFQPLEMVKMHLRDNWNALRSQV